MVGATVAIAVAIQQAMNQAIASLSIAFRG
jgi:hypothetical protein